MSIRSLDMQILVQKANDVARVQNNMHQDNINRQNEFAQDLQKQIIKDGKTILQTQKNEKSYINEKEEKEHSNQKKKNHAPKKEDLKGKNSNHLIINSNRSNCKIDITI